MHPRKLLFLLMSLVLVTLFSFHLYDSKYFLHIPRVRIKFALRKPASDLILTPEGRRLQHGPTRDLQKLSQQDEEILRMNKTAQGYSPREGNDGLRGDRDINDTRTTDKVTSSIELPKCSSYTPVGAIYVNTSDVAYSKLEKDLPWVQPGGFYEPEDCQARSSVAIIIPFRDREMHLNIFLRLMHQYLHKQKLRYRIYVIEQNDAEQPFNRGMLMNVGFTEALKRDNHDCFIFHDVDLLPEDDRNDYSCPTSPRHMSVAVSTMNYILQYAELFGGVEAFWKQHFLMINGFPNRYWGWGGEDDDLYQRVVKHRFKLTRPGSTVARYKMMSHGHKPGGENPIRHAELLMSWGKADKDGLNSLKYREVMYKEKPLHTLISVSLERETS